MGSGAAEIFGTSGGVAEAVIRCCTPDKSKNALRTIEHSGIRGTDAVRFAEVTINGRKVRAAIVHGLGSAAKLLDQIQSGEVQADLVEVMSCRTGCVGGAGQPYALMAKKLQRAQGLYEIDPARRCSSRTPRRRRSSCSPRSGSASPSRALLSPCTRCAAARARGRRSPACPFYHPGESDYYLSSKQ